MSEKINLQNLVDSLVEKHGLGRKEAETFVKEFFLLIEKGLEDENYVKVKSLGTFKLIEVESRESMNVNTGERFEIQGHVKVSFTPDTALKDLVNKPFAHFDTVVLNDETVLEDVTVSGEKEADQEESTAAVEKIAFVADTDEPTMTTEDQQETGDQPVVEIQQIVEQITAPQQVTPQDQSEPVPVQIKILSAEEIIAKELANVAKGPVRREVLEEVKPQETSSMSDPETPSNKMPLKYLITMIVIVLLICGGAIFYIYYPDLFAPSTNEAEKTQTVAVPQETPQTVDTLLVTKEVTADTTTVQPVPVPASVVTQAPVAPVQNSSQKFKITGTKTTHVIAAGESMRTISLQYYGTKERWSYILQYNSDVIKNPDVISAGIKLKIPELEANQ